MRALSNPIKIVSGITSSLLASLRFVIALTLVVLLLWIVGEMGYNVWCSREYPALAVFFLIALIVAIGGTIWRCVKPQHFGVPNADSGSLNILPLAILDLALIYAALFVSDQLDSPLTTPLLSFCQTIFNKLTS